MPLSIGRTRCQLTVYPKVEVYEELKRWATEEQMSISQIAQRIIIERLREERSLLGHPTTLRAKRPGSH